MTLAMYQVDAFTSRTFGGNPAAVCILEKWIDEQLMQQIAAENNVSETAFAVSVEGCYEIRWFTPLVEVDLCGHATLAAAHVLFEHHRHPLDRIQFSSQKMGMLRVHRSEDLLTLDFPADRIEEVEAPVALVEALGKKPQRTFRGVTDYILVYPDRKNIEQMDPDFVSLARLGDRGVIVTAKGNDVDFVSRFFAPGIGINEDPVTGSAHTTLTPYWAKELGKNRLIARQLSRRGGELICEDLGERVKISGKAVTYLEGEIHVLDFPSA
ncbi:MAG: PhzF family phenazine biosynthesis protein [Bacteroidales bacterium]